MSFLPSISPGNVKRRLPTGTMYEDILWNRPTEWAPVFGDAEEALQRLFKAQGTCLDALGRFSGGCLESSWTVVRTCLHRLKVAVVGVALQMHLGTS